MPKRKKTANDLTTEELAQRVFPKEAIEILKKIAHEKDEKKPIPPSRA